MKTRIKFKLEEGEENVMQGKNEIGIVGKGSQTYLWIGGKGCYGTLSGMKTLETLAASIYRALGHKPMWMKESVKKKLTKK